MTDSFSAIGAKSRVFVEQQNLVRGAFGRRNSQGYVEKPNSTPITVFRSTVRSALLHARASLAEDEFDTFLDWYHQQLANLDHDKLHANIGFDYLNGIVTAPKTTLAREIRWIAARLRRESDRIATFREHAEKIEHAILKTNGNGSIALLAKLTEEFGESMWSVQLRLGLEQLFNGLERQKRYHEHVRAQFKRGILAYVSYNTSVRNEDRTTFARFKDMVGKRIAARYEPELQHYLRYRLFNQWPSADHAIADILRAEQSHSIVDIYETFVSLSQEVVRRQDVSHVAPLISESLFTMAIPDHRLDKIRLHVDPRFSSTCTFRSAVGASNLVAGNLRDLIWSSARNNARKLDPWNIIYQAAAAAHAGRIRRHTNSVMGTFVRLLASLLTRSPTSSEDVAELRKFCGNFSGLPSVRAITDFIEQVEIELPNKALNLHFIGLNSAHCGLEDFGASELLDAQIKDFYTEPRCVAARPYSQLARVSDPSSDSNDSLTAFLKAVRLLRRENVAELPALLEPILARCESPPLRTLAAILLIRCKMLLGDRVGTILTIADEGARYPESIQFLPISEALSRLTYADYRPLVGTLIPPIALDMLWRATDDESVLSMLRFATTHFLRQLGSFKPSQLVDKGIELSRHQLIYFYRRICIPNILDVSRLFQNSREVLEERQAICGVLNSLGRVDKMSGPQAH